MTFHRTREKGAHTSVEGRTTVRLGASTQRRSIKSRRRECVNGDAQSLHGGTAEEQAGLAFDDGLGSAALGKDDRWAAACHGLDRDDAEVLDACQEYGAATAIELAQSLILHAPEKAGLGGGQRGQPASVRP